MPLPQDMEALIEGLLQESDLAPGSTFCSPAFQSDLQSFLQTQACSCPSPALSNWPDSDCSRIIVTCPCSLWASQCCSVLSMSLSSEDDAGVLMRH